MLCVGIVRHGYGAWAQIRDDPDLALADKFFLEEHRVDKKEERIKGEEKGAKSPGAVHLVRRADYLLSVLKEKTSNGTNLAAKRAVENHHRNNKKNGMFARRADGRPSISASPAPSGIRKGHRESDKYRHRGHSQSERRYSVERRNSQGDQQNGNTPRSDARRKYSSELDRKHRASEEPRQHQHHHRRSNDHSSSIVGTSDENDPMLKVLFKPVRESLKSVQTATKEGVKNKHERAKILRTELVKIGGFVRTMLEDEDYSSLEERVW